MVTKETITEQLNITSNEIAKKFSELYPDKIEKIAEELAVAFNNLLLIINHDEQGEISDGDFQAALLFWTGTNTIISSLELFRRGYHIEPLVILRHSLEIISTGYWAHEDPQIAKNLSQNKSIRSTESITKAKTIQPIIGPMYGMLSQKIVHISTLHSVPTGSKGAPLPVGGMYDPETLKYKPMILSMILTTTEILNSLIEVAFINKIKNIRLWKKVGDDVLEFEPSPEIKKMQSELFADFGEDFQFNN
jgi:hypothetical protein